MLLGRKKIVGPNSDSNPNRQHYSELTCFLTPILTIFLHQQCKMHNIAFDVPNSLGTLFFLIDSIVGGVISMLCVGDSRRASIEKMLNSLSFVGTSFGRDDEPGERSFDNLTEVLKNIKKTFSQDKHVGNDVQLHLT